MSAFDADMSTFRVLVNNRERSWWWVVGYEAGDVVFHYLCSIHARRSDQGKEAGNRLSTDLTIYSKKDSDEGRTEDRGMKAWGSG